MDIITLSLAKAYTDSQRLGYEDVSPVETKLNIRTSPQTDYFYAQDLGNGRYMLRARDTADLSIMDVVAVNVTFGGESRRYEMAEFEKSTIDGNAFNTAYTIPGMDHPLLYDIQMAFTEAIGIYVFYEKASQTWVTSVEVSTVHQIVSKFIPGILPVVDLVDSTDAAMGAPGTSVELSEAEETQVKSAMQTGLPVVVRLFMDGNAYMTILCTPVIELYLMGGITVMGGTISIEITAMYSPYTLTLTMDDGAATMSLRDGETPSLLEKIQSRMDELTTLDSSASSE